MCEDGKKNKGDEDMLKTETLYDPKTENTKLSKALKEVEMINSGKLSRKSAREFLKESRNK